MTSGTSRLTKKQNENSEPFEISYTMIRSGQVPIENILQELAIAIYVQLSRHEQQFPFVSPNNFERTTTYADKILFFGTSGCGKSRGRRRVGDSEFVTDCLEIHMSRQNTDGC